MTLDEFLTPGAEEALRASAEKDGYALTVLFVPTMPDEAGEEQEVNRLVLSWASGSEIACTHGMTLRPEDGTLVHDKHIVTPGFEERGFFEKLWHIWPWQKEHGMPRGVISMTEGEVADRYIGIGWRWEPTGETDKAGRARGLLVVDSDEQVEGFLGRADGRPVEDY